MANGYDLRWLVQEIVSTDTYSREHDFGDNQAELERAFLAGLDGSCRTPIAGLALLDGDDVTFRGEIVRPDGSERLTAERTGTAADAAEMGADAAAELRRQGGDGFFQA